MFFEPKVWEKGDPITLNSAAVIRAEGYAAELLKKAVAEYGAPNGTVREITVLPAEGEQYRLELSAEKIVLRGHAIYAAVTLLQMAESGALYAGLLEDAPDCAFRGYRLYLPGRESFDDFFRLVDMLVYLKYNYISLEIGGAMEYKRHPEINEKWAEFAADMRRYSGRTSEIQNQFNWAKNSIHIENGDGEILTQDEVRALVAYCRARGLNAYPEVPTLSHSDYICMAHPEIREREEDPYPDTYCPNHPDTYKIVFDILDEVIDVFHPDLINIGHDEFYTVALCPRCRGKEPDELYAQDITKIHDYLQERGIKTCMWAEKLLTVVLPNGKTYGGAGSWRENRRYPPMFRCQCMLPKDILMLHWYHSFGEQHDFVYHTHGYPVVYGNMAPERLVNWRVRRERGILGGSCSNWGSNEPEYMQRNCQYLHLIYGAYALWSADYDTNMQPAVLEKTYQMAYQMHFGNRPAIRIAHTTALNIPYHPFWCGVFIENEVYHMGWYEVTYTDGATARFEVKYGTNISWEGVPCLLGSNAEGFNETGLDESALGELCYSAIPFVKDGKTWYRTQFENPYPEKTVEKIEYLPDREAQVDFVWEK